MKPAPVFAMIFASVACSTAPREHPLGDEDPCLFYEQRWRELSTPILAEIKSLGEHPWAGEYLTGELGLLYMAPRAGWAALDSGCEPPLDFAWGTVVESDKGLEFRYASGAPVSRDDFENYILAPIQALRERARWEEDWLDKTGDTKSRVLRRWIARLDSVLASVIAGRR